MKSARILYVEDDQTFSFVTRENLGREGYQVDYCEDGLTALEKIQVSAYDLYILDVMLPKMDGFTLARKIREQDEAAPIIFLSARSTMDDRIHGLQIGADDYITKPFSIEELILKIEVFLKRSRIDKPRHSPKEPVKLGIFTFNPEEMKLVQNNHVQTLTHKESELLLFLVRNPGTIVKRDEILIKVWGNDHFFSSRSLDVFISRLRKLLKADDRIRIENIHNIGYRFILAESDSNLNQ